MTTAEPNYLTEKRCPHCDQIKPTSEFRRNRNARDGLQSYCSTCQTAYHQAWRTGLSGEKHQAYRERKNREARERAARAAERRAKWEARSTETREGKAQFVTWVRLHSVCEDCGWWPRTPGEAPKMHFHHIDPGHKIATGRKGKPAVDLAWSYARICEEIANHCVTLCLSCHSKRTREQFAAVWNRFWDGD